MRRGATTGRLTRTLALREMVLALAALHGMGPALAAGSYRRAVGFMRGPGGAVPGWLEAEVREAKLEATASISSAWDEHASVTDPRLGRCPLAARPP